MSKIQYDTVYKVAWWLCVVTLPWTIPLNSYSLVFLAIVWLAELNFSEKWQRLKNAPWIWPFLAFLFLHIVGLLYSQQLKDGFFEIEKKDTFLALPLIAATGRPILNEQFAFLKKTFICSCLIVVVVSFALTGAGLINDSSRPPQNFDSETTANFHFLNPNASTDWEYFSYLQLGEWIDMHPAYFSMYLIFCIAILANAMFELQKSNWLDLILISLFTFFIGLLASRMAIVSYLVLALYLTLRYGSTQKKNSLVVSPILFFLVLCAVIWFNPVSRFRILQEPLTTSYNINPSTSAWTSMNFRVMEWRACAEELKSSWATGVGTGDGQPALQKHYSAYNPGSVALTYNAHNQYLQTTLELGIAGLILLSICIFKPLLSSETSSLQIAFVLLFGLMCLTESMLARQKGIVFFTLFQSLFYRSTVL